jgi:3-deoxy-D-manno-octulosonate 8-phosphate phosphatase (KDO 8-P phosphatase)
MIKYLICDIDGTLTDGKITYGPFGIELKSFNVKDGSALKKLLLSKVVVILISGRSSHSNLKRAKEIGVTRIFQNVSNKEFFVKKLIHEKGYILTEGAYFGDDINDLKAMNLFEHRFCPIDAHYEVKEICTFISPEKGGSGSSVFIVDYIMRYNLLGGKL